MCEVCLLVPRAGVVALVTCGHRICVFMQMSLQQWGTAVRGAVLI